MDDTRSTDRDDEAFEPVDDLWERRSYASRWYPALEDERDE